MAARTLINDAPVFFITVCGAILLAAWLSAPAHADQPTINIEISPNVMVNTDYNIYIILNDSSNGSSGKTITLSVTSPNSSITSPVTTNMTGYAAATFHTSTAAGYNNITATYLGINYSIPVYVNPGPPYSVDLTVDHEFRLANGMSIATASAKVVDQYGNAVNNLQVNFTIDGVMSSSMTGSSGIATRTVGPYSSTHTANISANVNGLADNASVRFLDRNNLFLFRYPNATMPIGSYVEVDAVFYEDLSSSTPAVGVPLNFTAYGPDYSVLGTLSAMTDANGIVKFYFNLSQITGNNTIQVSNGDLGGTLKSTVIYGEGGDVSRIILSSNPSSPILADGTSKYTLSIWAVDAGGNPVKNKQLSIVKNYDTNYTKYVTTNNYGYASIDISPSLFVHNDLYTVSALVYYLANNSTVEVNNSIMLGYIAGPPAIIKVVANPNAVANANVSTPPGGYDVHTTDIITTITDQWGHPIAGQPVNVTSLNTTLGNITGPSSGITADSGEFTTQFTLSSSNRGNDLAVGAPILATSGSLAGTCNVLYTENSFLSVKSDVSPKTNVSVNDTINVSITVRGIGWKIKGQSYDVALIFDSSGSMNWLSTTIFPENGSPLQGTMASEDTRYNITTFYNHKVQDLQFMLSSSYSNFSNGSYYYSLRVKGPDGKTYYGTNYDNENCVIIPSAAIGNYTISGKFKHTAAGGWPPYNVMVLTQPKRLGLNNRYTNDSDSAAKVAGRQFVDNMTDNQVSIIWFNSSSKVAKYLTLVNSQNKSSIYNAINSLNANGGTEIGDGIAKAISELTGPYSNSSNKKVAILLSDGYSQTPSNDIEQAYNAKNKSITIYTIGMGMPDEYNLGMIANITGGYYTKVVSDIQLQHVYGDIAGELRKIVANETEMHIITSCTMINGTLYPDAEYVPHSAYVRYPNGTVVQQEPTINADGTYDLQWNPGVIKLNDTWTLNYQLIVRRGGLIEPITNKSYINFTREDGSRDTTSFAIDSLFVNNSIGNDFGINSTTLNVTIKSPIDTSTAGHIYNMASSGQNIKWKVNYTGNYSYTQTIYIDGDASTIKTNYPWDNYTWEGGDTPGEYKFVVIAYEVMPNNQVINQSSDYICLRRLYDNGVITLK
ncbi:Bacterial Ig-like domain (group 1)/von Willebrand factor type A domain-containing protein [Methanocella conradii HZ254]|uniref:Bacterial Ig-like domain (Group 1)/von Willebrand factor type A domain-containing protein n=1 Tax=Methanocella conradii (strain DSM 24694 / JCM 17849 / CGMCC 1.5162 / HZ254) TaxID=1041930 RepID=H8I8F2_METCZ|nr:VWA domain-containing protein [Methanocella conradii]AFC99005.1 Bacterial Ig-like domain (group 1)/von Willebrand factor type A domain-containing protein [Methanocella conradii HZ254]